jgi:hypothetical protein
MNPESPTFHQITEQHDSGKRATVLTKRANGEIQTASYTGQKDERGRYYVELNERDETGANKYRAMTADNLSDEGQAHLAEELASSRAVEGDREGSEEISEDAREAIEQFMRRGDEQLAGFNERTVHQLAIVEDVRNALNTVRYRGGDKHGLTGAFDQLQQLQTVLMHEQSTFDEEFRPMVRRLQGAVEEAVSDARRAESETLYAKLRGTTDAAEEIEANTRILGSINEDSLSDVRTLVRTMDEYLRDNWGEETYQASLGQKLDTLEDTLHNRRARGSALQETLPRLGTALR